MEMPAVTCTVWKAPFCFPVYKEASLVSIAASFCHCLIPMCLCAFVMNQVRIILGRKELNTSIMRPYLQICISQFYFFLNIIFYIFI